MSWFYSSSTTRPQLVSTGLQLVYKRSATGLQLVWSATVYNWSRRERGHKLVRPWFTTGTTGPEPVGNRSATCLEVVHTWSTCEVVCNLQPVQDRSTTGPPGSCPASELGWPVWSASCRRVVWATLDGAAWEVILFLGRLRAGCRKSRGFACRRCWVADSSRKTVNLQLFTFKERLCNGLYNKSITKKSG